MARSTRGARDSSVDRPGVRVQRVQSSAVASSSASPTSAPDDWKLSTIGWVFSVAIVFLGLSAAVFGAWLERVGPRKAMFASARLLRRRISGRCARCRAAPVLARPARLRRDLAASGLGSATSRRCRRSSSGFPTGPGMATGLAIMGFGGGAMIASPLSTMLMAHFKTPRRRASRRRS